MEAIFSDQSLSFYNTYGYVMVDSAFSKQEVDLLIDSMEPFYFLNDSRLVREKSGEVRSIYEVHKLSHVFKEFCGLKRLVYPAKMLLNDDIYIHQTKVNIKKSFEGDWWEWHQDFPYWNIYDGMPEPNVVSAMVFLDEVTEFNGPLYLVPGSHVFGISGCHKKPKKNMVPSGETYKSSLSADLEFTLDRQVLKAFIDQKGIVTATGLPGSVLFFHGNTFHSSNCNLSPDDRKVLIITYNSVQNACIPPEANPRPSFLCNNDHSALTIGEEVYFVDSNILEVF